MHRVRRTQREASVFAALVLLIVAFGAVVPRAGAQGPDLVISEIVASNDSHLDAFDATPDWLELRNDGPAVDLAGWSLHDGDGHVWTFPSTVLEADARLVIYASGRNVVGPELHTNFSLDRAGEQVRLFNADGTLVDALTYPVLLPDQAYGRTPSGDTGFLVEPTPGSPNAALIPGAVVIESPSHAFVGSTDIALSADLSPGQTIRYTLNGASVDDTADEYTGPIRIQFSSVIRVAVVASNGVVGPESFGVYSKLAGSLSGFSSNLPVVLVHSAGVIGQDMVPSIMTVVEPGDDGRAELADDPSHGGFAGLRVRGASSANFAKKQYKLETWADPFGAETDADLLGMGADGDWGLYAPGRYDRAMINNPLMYELGAQVGVAAPEWRFVELFVEDNPVSTIGTGDYRGIYILRETIEIDEERLDIDEHTPASAGPDGGFVVRYDWADDCCTEIARHPQFGSRIAIDAPNTDRISAGQTAWITSWWQGLQTAAATGFDETEPLIDTDNLLDGWLLEMLAMDVDILRASHYMHLDAGGRLRAGPLWDYDRALGSADQRGDELVEAEAWEPNGASGHSYESDIYADLWTQPEIRARLAVRWEALRAGPLSDSALGERIDDLGAELTEAYSRELTVWNDGAEYGPRFDGGLSGELDHMASWLAVRAAWLDTQLTNDADAPLVTAPAPFASIEENELFTLAIEATDDDDTLVFMADGLPADLSINSETGVIAGRVGYGDGGSFDVEVVVADSSGASTAVDFVLDVTSPLVGDAAVVLTEFNAVADDRVLHDDGIDPTFGPSAGNGGDWFEVVVLDDQLDMRGWQFDVWSRTDTGSLIQRASLVLADEPLLAGLASSTILTIAETVADDASYDPAAGDWTINLQANNAQDGGYFANQTDFDTNHQDWRLVIRDDQGNVRARVIGETEGWRQANDGAGLGDHEVFTIDAEPSAGSDPNTDWIAAERSSFGQAPVVHPESDGDPIDPDASTIPGDVDCDGRLAITDALLVAQFAVGTRVAASCPLTDITSQIAIDGADVNKDGSVNVVDSLLITQCAVGLNDCD